MTMGDTESLTKAKDKDSAEKPKSEDFSAIYDRLVDRLEKVSGTNSIQSEYPIHSYSSISSSVPDQIKKSKTRKEIENDGLQQDQTLKKYTLIVLFFFLALETVVVFIFAYLQGIGKAGDLDFRLDPWSFRLLLTATILQITAMLAIAVRHLFPSDKKVS